MVQNTTRVEDIQGLTPAVDPTRTDRLFALDGRNYYFDAIGPRSGFGDRLLVDSRLPNPSHWQSVRIRLATGVRVFTFTNDSILEWNETGGNWQFVYVLPDTSLTPHRWTWAYLNQAVYFCHPRVGLLVLDLTSNVMQTAKGAGIPTDAIACASDNGRLGILTDKFLYWSEQSNGLELTPTLGGAGFQLISDRVSGDPIMLTSYAEGFLVWTTGGIMRSEFTGGAEVYRHRSIDTEYKPINSFCVVKVSNDTTIIFDGRGLFQSKGNVPEPYTPLFNEFLIDYFQRSGIGININSRLEWDENRRLLYLSYSNSLSDPLFENTFVLYPPVDKWGQFNANHYGIGPVEIKSSLRSGEYFGYCDENGQVHYWTIAGSRQISNQNDDTDYLETTLQKPFGELEASNGVLISSSTGKANVRATAAIATTGFYLYNSPAVVSPSLQGLDAILRVGLFRAAQFYTADQMQEVIQVLVRSGEQGDPTEVGNVFQLSSPEGFDYNQAGTIDYETAPVNYVNHDLVVVGTLDGRNSFNMYVADVAGFTQTMRLFTCAVPGMWHYLEFQALAVGQQFHIRTLELITCDAGRLT